jgi:hypothetical protein
LGWPRACYPRISRFGRLAVDYSGQHGTDPQIVPGKNPLFNVTEVSRQTRDDLDQDKSVPPVSYRLISFL